MLNAIKNAAATAALKGLRDKFMNPNIEGIAIIHEISFRDKKLYLRVELEGLKDHPIDVIASDIKIADDWSTLTVGMYESNMPFAQNALNRFATMPISIPDGAPRIALGAAKKALGL